VSEATEIIWSIPFRLIIKYREFNDDIGKDIAIAAVAALPDAWKADVFASSLTYTGVSHFHKPGIVYAVDLVVAVPNK